MHRLISFAAVLAASVSLSAHDFWIEPSGFKPTWDVWSA
jgi:hypothetical protein